MKSSPNFYKTWPKGRHWCFNLKMMFFKKAQKVTNYLYGYCNICCPRHDIQKSSNLVTLEQTVWSLQVLFWTDHPETWNQFLGNVSVYFLIMRHSRPLFLYFYLYNAKNSPMTGIELRTSGIRSDRSANWATTAAQISVYVCVWRFLKHYDWESSNIRINNSFWNGLHWY